MSLLAQQYVPIDFWNMMLGDFQYGDFTHYSRFDI
jgi:hypothetical protein